MIVQVKHRRRDGLTDGVALAHVVIDLDPHALVLPHHARPDFCLRDGHHYGRQS